MEVITAGQELAISHASLVEADHLVALLAELLRGVLDVVLVRAPSEAMCYQDEGLGCGFVPIEPVEGDLPAIGQL